MRFGLLFGVMASLSFLSCQGDPESVLLPPNPDAWGDDVKKAMERLDDEDQKKVAAYAMRLAMGKAFGSKSDSAEASALTIGQAIENQEAWEAEQAKKEAVRKKQEEEQAALAAKVEAQRKAAVEKMNVKGRANGPAWGRPN